MCDALAEARQRGVPPTALFVDIGAAAGQETKMARKAGHPVLAFECRPEAYLRLVYKLGEDENTTFVGACLSDKPGVARLLRAGDSSSVNAKAASRLSKVTKEGRTVTKEGRKNLRERIKVQHVPVLTLDDVLESHPILQHASVGFIKLDIEGAETSALRGAARTIRKHRPFLYYEDSVPFTATAASRRKARVLWDAFGSGHPMPPHGANVSVGYQCETRQGFTDTFCRPVDY